MKLMNLSLDVGRILHRPLDPTRVQFLPKNPKPRVEGKRDGPWYCLALAYYEVWDLVTFLNTHLYTQWHIRDQDVLFSEQDNRIIVWLVLDICGVTMAGVGEAFLDAETNADENAITSAWAQAFKRACALFGLGLGVYFLPNISSRYVAYDAREKKISVPDDVLLKLARELYARTPDHLLCGTVGREGQDVASLRSSILHPFAPQEIEFLPKPGSRRQEQDGSWVCEANRYVAVWSLVRRLNAIAFGVWSVPRVSVSIARNTAIVTVWVQIGDTLQTGVWQEPLTVSDSQRHTFRAVDDVVTTAYSYAFKRACHLHGLGLYLRFLPTPTVPLVKNRIGQESLSLAIALYKANRLPLAVVPQGAALPEGGTSSVQEQPSSEDDDVAGAKEDRRGPLWSYLQNDPARVRGICKHYQVDSFDALTDAQLSELDIHIQEAGKVGTVTQDQMDSLRQLCQHFHEPIPDSTTFSYNSARALLLELTTRYKQAKK